MYKGKLIVWKQNPYSQILTSLHAFHTPAQVNFSSFVASLSAFKRAWMNERSPFDSQLTLSG